MNEHNERPVYRNEGPECGVGFELSCANCGQIVSCERSDHDLITRELVADPELGFAHLLAAMSLAGWAFRAEQFVVGDTARVVLTGTPCAPDGRPAPRVYAVTVHWIHTANSWVVNDLATGYERIDGGDFMIASVQELAARVAQQPTSWVSVPTGR
ncbi:hypothetical protein ACWEKT_02765 [Nocardia takedensis]